MRIIFLGDSITAGAGAGTVGNMYTAQIEKLTGAEVLNYGVGGTRIARQTKPSADPSFDKDFLQRAQTMEKEADLVFVFGGTNDYGHGDAPIGAITDETPYTFCGALNSLIDYLSGVYGVEKLWFILPVHRKNEDNPHGEFGCKKIAAGSLSDYINAEISVLDNRGVGYLDLRDVIPADKLDELTADGVHPDATGHKLLAEAIISRCGLIALNEYYKWLAATINDEKTHDELLSIKGDKDEINDRFYCELKFGTGGLRGKLGAGTNRVNIYTVGRATRGLAAYINKTATENKSAVIAYDSRNMSREFAFLAADILSGAGIKTYVFNTLTPTPVLSFAVRYLKTSAGIVITASHNPKEYNGYKVYNEKGCQITDGAAKEILSEIEKCGYFEEIRADKSIIEVLDDSILNEFLREIQKYSLFGLDGVNTPKIVYTPLNGTGNIPVRSILKIIGVKDVTVVPEQENPDGNFPTCPYPNPEEKAALKLAAELAEKENADLVLATDPDADRIGIAVKTNDGLKLLNGNETGVLMEDFIFSLRKKTDKIPVVVKTIVTSDMSEDIAKSYGAQVKEVLTGFKYIGETIDKLSENEEYVFGMEESYGYLVGTHARDKDAVSAAMIIAEMTAYYGLQGKTLADKLDELYKKYGYYKTALKSVSFLGEKGKAQMDEIISSLRNEPWKELCGEKVAVKDYSLGINGLPKSNVLSFTGENIKVTVRPSGTEPKLKLYYQVKAKSENDAEKLLQKVKISVEENFNK